MPHYRKKPVVIEAMMFTGTNAAEIAAGDGMPCRRSLTSRVAP